MSTASSRRTFLESAIAGGVGFAATGCGAGSEPETTSGAERKRSRWEPRIAENIGSLDDATLTWLAQLGHKWVVLQGTDAFDRDAKGYWTADDIAAVRERCATFGMQLHSLMIPLGWLMNSMLGKPERDGDIEKIRRSIEAGGKAGVTVFEWRWSPDFKWGDEVGYYSREGRGGAVYRAFDYSRVANKPPFPELGKISSEALLERLIYFSKPVMEAAESANLKMSLHPKDPPVKVMRGIERLFTNTAEMEAFLDAVPSPANGFTFCQGTVTEMGVDVIDAIRRIGGRGRIHHVHFRGVQGHVPRYTESFIDEGDVDMLAAMRAYRDVNYPHALVSDHTPQVIGEIAGGKIGRSFSQGYICGLVQAVNAEG